MDPFLGEIRPVAFNFAPRGWAFCDGSLLSIAQNTALFSLLGTTYGGNGQTTFALPDLRGRVPVSSGQGPGLSAYALGQEGGFEQITLNLNQVPAHDHLVSVSETKATSASPVDNLPAVADVPVYATHAGAGTLAQTAIGLTGGSPHDNLQPYNVVNYVIALQGIFPSRN